MAKDTVIKLSRKFILEDLDLDKKEIATLVSISAYVNDKISDENHLVTEPINILTIMGRMRMGRDKNHRNYKTVHLAIQRMLSMEIISRSKYYDDMYRYYIHLPYDFTSQGQYLELSNSIFEQLVENYSTFSKSSSLLSCYIAIASQCYEPDFTEEELESEDRMYFNKIQEAICSDHIRRISLRYNVSARTAYEHINELIKAKLLYGAKADTKYEQTELYLTLPKYKELLKQYITFLRAEDKITRSVFLSKFNKV